MSKIYTIEQLIRISDSFKNHPPQKRSKHKDNRRVSRIKDSSKRFVKRKVKDTFPYFDDYNSFGEIPYVGSAIPLEGYSTILAIKVGDTVQLLPTMYPEEQMAVINSADQQTRFRIVSLYKDSGCTVTEMSGMIGGTLVTGDM